MLRQNPNLQSISLHPFKESQYVLISGKINKIFFMTPLIFLFLNFLSDIKNLVLIYFFDINMEYLSSLFQLNLQELHKPFP